MTASVFALGPLELLFVLLFGGSPPLGLLSLPPLPEDATLLKMAPEKCVYYLGWAGMAEADPASANQTERLLAEEEIRRFGRVVTDQVTAAIARAGRQSPQGAVFAQEVPKLVKLALTRPGEVFLADLSLGAGQPDARGGLVINVGREAQSVAASIGKLERAAFGTTTAGPWHRLPSPPGTPVVEWGLAENYLIVGVGPGMAEEIAARRSQPAPPEWLTEVRRLLPVKRPSALQLINVQAILGVLAPVAGPPVVGIADTLGLSQARYVASVGGLDENGAVGRTLVLTEGTPKGVLKLLAGEPLRPEDLAAVPADATFAFALRLDANQFLSDVLEVVGSIDRSARDFAEIHLDRVDAELGLSIREDLLQALGEAWTLHSSPSEGGLLVTGLTFSVSVRDHARLARAHERLLGLVRQGLASGGGGGRVSVGEFEFGGERIYFLNSRGEGLPVAPAWCLSKDHLSIAISPQVLKAHLARPASEPSLVEVAAVKAQLRGQFGPQLLCYGDVPTIFRTIYPLVQLAAPLACAELQRSGVAIDASLLPSARAIAPHLQPSVIAFGRHEHGLLLASQGTLPGDTFSPLAAVAPVFLFVARSEARTMPGAVRVLVPGEAARVQSMNNLKQLGLGMHNYHDSHKKFPVGKKDAPGAGLSWRVHLLPYLEQDALYRQFHLDEPWDSAHNKQLLGQMPEIYKAPGSSVAGQFKTVYLVPRGAQAMFPPDRDVRIQDIFDGTSYTIMIVEARDEAAVEWTRPDDFDAEGESLADRLIGLRENGFLATFADGSVRQVPRRVDAGTLKALFTRAGREPVAAGALGD